ncbi:MAG: AAA family ATPase, partial [Candidatus Endolissoclinum sp.]|nr:AAA family ATPase [Candidatus Endolissoclinum sp.]
MSEVKNYSADLQKLFVQFMLTDPQLFTRIMGIVDDRHFDRDIRNVVKYIISYSNEYQQMPTVQMIKAETGQDMELLEDIAKHNDWFIDEFETFCRHKAIERAIVNSADLLEEGKYGEVETTIKDAVQIGLTRSLGIDYFDDPRKRLEHLKDNNGQITTGWKDLDDKLYGGINRGEVTIFAGGSGSGKSLFMQNMSLNWAQMGLNCVYVTLELSEELSAMRIDAMVTDKSTRRIFKELDDVELKVKTVGKKAGMLRIKYMSSGSTINDVRSYLKELQIVTGKIVDCICIDYLDLVMPITKKVNPGDLFIKDKYVTEEMRNFSMETQTVFVTASQLNRSAVEEIEFDHSHIAGGISKIQTADNVIGIFTSNAMRERGQYQLQLLKTRSSSGVGSKINLVFDRDSLRISDSDLDDDDLAVGTQDSQTSKVMDTLKRKSTITDSNDTPSAIPPEKSESAINLRAMV